MGEGWRTMTGLQGDYRDSCSVCLRGTDTALAFAGSPDWVVAGMIVLGIPSDEATAMLSGTPGEVPNVASMKRAIRVCEECAARAGMSVGPLMAGGSLPTYRPLDPRDQ